MSKSVARRLAALPNTPPLTAWPNGEWADSSGKRTDLKNWAVAVDPGPCSHIRCTHPIRISVKQGKLTAFGDQHFLALVSELQTTLVTNVRL